jgi:hypothetical protein
MRYLVGFVFVLALGVMGCSETTGTGGSGGDGYVCRPATGDPGTDDGGYYSPELPGVYSGGPEAIGEQRRVGVRFETSSDCTALVPSTECAIDSGNTEPAFFEIEFEGLDERGEMCSAGITVTTEMVTEVPIQDARFAIELTDDDGAAWLINGDWYRAPYGVVGSVRRTDGDTYCEGGWFASGQCVF